MIPVILFAKDTQQYVLQDNVRAEIKQIVRVMAVV